jgi:hypothetical protein
MANKLRNTSAKISFFAFLDMITTVTGVLLLITLLLTFSLKPKASPAGAALDKVRDQLQQARATLEASMAELRQRQLQAATLTNRVFVVPEADRSGKEPVLVVLSATNGFCTRLGQTNAVEFLARSDGADFGRMLDSWDPRKERLVFYIRPSAVLHFRACQQLAVNRSFDIGYDAAEEDLQYILATP